MQMLIVRSTRFNNLTIRANTVHNTPANKNATRKNKNGSASRF